MEHRQAAACAYSIGITNPGASVSLIVPDIKDVAKQYEEPFDNIIELPFDKTIQTRRANDWQTYWATPYENTIAIDCKTIVKENHSAMWDYLTEQYKMQMIYSDMFFFRKEQQIAINYFKLLDPYSREWRSLLNKIFEPHHIPDYYDANIINSIAVNHLDIVEEATPAHPSILQYIDMHTAQETILNKEVETYLDYINVWSSTNAKLKIQNFAVNTCIAYRHGEFLTDDIYNGQRDYYRLNNKQNLVGTV